MGKAHIYDFLLVMKKMMKLFFLLLTNICIPQKDGWWFRVLKAMNSSEHILKKKYSTVFEGSDIIGEIEYTHPANDTGSMKLDVHSSEGIQNHFNGAYDADTSCHIRDIDGNVVASVTPSRSRITKLTVQKGLTVHEKKVLLSQLIKTCIYNYNIHQSLPVFFAVTQPTSYTSFIKDTFTCTNYKDAFTNLKQKHRV